MGYREDGNFNINWEYDGLTDPGKYAKENAKFIYPDAGIRFLQGQAALDAAMGRVTTLTKGDYKLHRGYIRNLEQPQFGPVPITRCNFQFNPQQIQQNVSMRDDVYLPMLQPPEQLAQPLGANVNFSFDLLFDRSHELAKGSLSSGLGFEGTADQAERNTPGSTADTNAIGENDAYDIGVLADLRVLYSVIGQGFSKEMIDFQAKMFEYNANNQFDIENPSDTTTTESTTDETTADTGTPPSSQQSPKLTDIENLINSNVGNFALLMPMPVRVMFSSLFMVDGFITSTSVDFLKFNTKMVPVQCRVGLSMNALYIGFARQTTYLTDTFRRAADAIAARNAPREELLAALIISCKTFLIGASWEPMTSQAIDWDKAKTLRHGYEFPVWALAIEDEGVSNKKNLFLGFPDIEPVKGGNKTIVIGGEEIVIEEGQDLDAILTLYQNGVPIQFTYNWSITVHGRVPGEDQLPPLTEAIAKRFKYGTLSPEQAAAEKIKVLGSYSGTESSSSENDWGKGTSGDGVDAKRVRRRSIRPIKNTASGSYKVGGLDGLNTTWANNSYFIIEIAVDFSVSSGESQPITYSYKSKEVKKGDQDFDRRIFISWTGAGAGNGGTENPTMPIGRLGE